MDGGQVFVAVAQVVLADLRRGVAVRLKQFGDGGVFVLQALLRARHADLEQTDAEGVLAGNEGCTASRAGLLSIRVGEERPPLAMRSIFGCRGRSPSSTDSGPSVAVARTGLHAPTAPARAYDRRRLTCPTSRSLPLSAPGPEARRHIIRWDGRDPLHYCPPLAGLLTVDTPPISYTASRVAVRPLKSEQGEVRCTPANMRGCGRISRP